MSDQESTDERKKEPFPPSESEYNPCSTSESPGSELDHEEENSETQFDDPTNQPDEIKWKKAEGASLQTFKFTGPPRINISKNLTPVEIFRSIVDNYILILIMLETNKNAKNYNKKWKDTTIEEIKTFFAILLYIGLARYPKISDY